MSVENSPGFDYGVDEIRIDACGTCSKTGKVAVFAPGGEEAIRLCHSCLVELANVVFDAEVTLRTIPE